MTQPNPSTALARALVDEMTRGGVRLFVVSPGSRSAALAIAADEHPVTAVRVVTDERSASFQALGYAKSTGLPAVAISTSGTAPANYLPAVIEAEMSLTPLIVVSADRPEELRGVGSNQTIDQTDLYGGHLAHAIELPTPDHRVDGRDGWRSAAAIAVDAALGAHGRPGPVHINVGFREPTAPVADDGRTTGYEYPFAIEGRRDGGRWATTLAAPPSDLDLSDLQGPGLVIAGDGEYDRPALMEEAGRLGWPVLATAQSGLRGEKVVSTYHHMLADGIHGERVPKSVIAIGSVGPSQRLEALIGTADRRVRIDFWGRPLNPGLNATDVLHGDPVQALGTIPANSETSWAANWQHLESGLRRTLLSALGAGDDLTGASVAVALNQIGWESLFVGSSLPIRDVDAHLGRGGQVIANRGASGIDGSVSTALGAASAGPRTLAVLGDLAVLHDSNGFMVDVTDDLAIIIVDNGGGGLFDSLPLARFAPDFERLFVAPPGRDFRTLAQLHHVGFTEVETSEDLIEHSQRALDSGGRWLIRVPVDRRADLDQRSRLDAAARQFLESSD